METSNFARFTGFAIGAILLFYGVAGIINGYNQGWIVIVLSIIFGCFPLMYANQNNSNILNYLKKMMGVEELKIE